MPDTPRFTAFLEENRGIYQSVTQHADPVLQNSLRKVGECFEKAARDVFSDALRTEKEGKSAVIVDAYYADARKEWLQVIDAMISTMERVVNENTPNAPEAVAA